MYEVVYSKNAVKALAQLSVNKARLIREKIGRLAKDPLAPNPKATKLVGRPGYRLRIGDWRVIYEVQHGRLMILVLEIGPREGIYR